MSLCHKELLEHIPVHRYSVNFFHTLTPRVLAIVICVFGSGR